MRLPLLVHPRIVMELALLIGIPGSGKSTFCRERFFASHLRLSLDMLRTRRRERLLLDACLATGTPVVIDNTNVSREERALFIGAARAARFRVAGYYLRTELALALERNASRVGRARVPNIGLLATHSRLRLPEWSEGFDELFFVSQDGRGGFAVEPWKSEPQSPAQVLEGEPLY